MNFKKFDENRARELFDRLYSPKETPEEKTKPSQTQPKIKSLKDYWEIDNVFYNNQNQTYLLSKNLIDLKTQEKHLEHANKVKESDFHIADMPLYHAIFKSIANSNSQEPMNFINQSMKNYWIMTATGILYSPKGKDKIIHKLENISTDIDFIGPNEYVKDSKTKNIYKALLGEDNLAEINNLYNKITGKDSYLWRLNSKPNSLDERVLRFGLNGGGFYLGAYGGLVLSVRCFGVCVADSGGNK